MPKTKISEFDVDPANNTDINSINIAEGCAPSGINNAIRQLMADLKEFQTGAGGDPFNGAINGTVGATTPAAGTFTSLSDSGNLTFTGTGNRITGDFSNATIANRTMFQNSVTNAVTTIGVLPNGTATTARHQYFGSSDPANSSLFTIGLNSGSEANLSSSATGTGSFLPITFQTSNSERMRIDTSGNVGIGTSSPATIVHAQKASGNTYYRAQNNLANVDFGVDGAGTGILWNNSNYPLAFGTNNSERMRIDSSGNLLVGTTSLVNNERLSVKQTGAGVWPLILLGEDRGAVFRITASSGYAAYFERNNGTYTGDIFITSSGTTTFNTASDYRLKENIAPMTGALAKVSQLKPVTYTWKSNGEASQGFIAHELAEVAPDCVTGEKDAVDAEGKPQYQGIDTSFLVATLTAAIQEQTAIINDLKARIETLESK
jgi:hypothetical protein